jgi:hypothetical protein
MYWGNTQPVDLVPMAFTNASLAIGKSGIERVKPEVFNRLSSFGLM